MHFNKRIFKFIFALILILLILFLALTIFTIKKQNTEINKLNLQASSVLIGSGSFVSESDHNKEVSIEGKTRIYSAANAASTSYNVASCSRTINCTNYTKMDITFIQSNSSVSNQDTNYICISTNTGETLYYASTKNADFYQENVRTSIDITKYTSITITAVKTGGYEAYDGIGVAIY